jgi:hypothetical protein
MSLDVSPHFRHKPIPLIVGGRGESRGPSVLVIDFRE